MQIRQFSWRLDTGWMPVPPDAEPFQPDLILTFGSPRTLRDGGQLERVSAAFPGAIHLGCSTAGEIEGTRVVDDSLVVTAARFAATRVTAACARIDDPSRSFAVGQQLAASLEPEGLRHALLFSDGLVVNGSELVRGLQAELPPGVTVTGGLAGDGPRFQQTFVIWNGVRERGLAVIAGFYGERLAVGYGSLGGWDPFGPERLITRAIGNVLYELDNRSALALYKTYLGEHAAGLPATGLLFPLSLRTTVSDAPVVRTILAVDEADQSMTFAGDMPVGAYARLMKANFDRLIDGAVGAARACSIAVPDAPPAFALLISCVGRKLLLGQRIEEEVEGVREVLGDAPVFAGFYSYGEISPFTPDARCELHNQTMTITTLAERAG